MHPAEERLRTHLPLILSYAKEQMRSALACLEEVPRAKITDSIINDFFGSSDKNIGSTLYGKLSRMAPYVYRLTPKHIKIYGSKHNEFGENVSARVNADADVKLAFLAGKEGEYIQLAAINLGRTHMEAIATTILHEVSHLVLNTVDTLYSRNALAKGTGQFMTCTLSSLIKIEEGKKISMLNNADSIACAICLLHYSKSNDPEHQMMMTYYSGCDTPHLRYHSRAPGLVPRIASPILNRKSFSLFRLFS